MTTTLQPGEFCQHVRSPSRTLGWYAYVYMRPHRLWQHRCRADACCHAECVGYHHRELIQSGTSCWCPPEVKVSARDVTFFTRLPQVHGAQLL
jgi:hypothetical protein